MKGHIPATARGESASDSSTGTLGSNANLDLARSVMETNLFGTWEVTQAFLPLL